MSKKSSEEKHTKTHKQKDARFTTHCFPYSSDGQKENTNTNTHFPLLGSVTKLNVGITAIGLTNRFHSGSSCCQKMGGQTLCQTWQGLALT